MGDILQVRVMVYTPDPEAVEKAWPLLSELAWPAGSNYAPAKRGALELVDTLAERLRYGEVSKGISQGLLPEAEKIQALKEQLEAALGDWDSTLANKLTVKIEQALAALETRAGNL
jgi:hypothetical protein